MSENVEGSQFYVKDPPNSALFGVSVRAWVVLLLVMGVVFAHTAVTLATLYHAIRTGDFSQVGSLTTISEPYYGMIGLAIGFYFGQAKRDGK